jgi:hypothetical protein
MSKTMITRLQESGRATNIYLTNEAALHLAHRLIRQVEIDSGVRIVILNKQDDRPDFQVFHYPVKGGKNK